MRVINMQLRMKIVGGLLLGVLAGCGQNTYQVSQQQTLLQQQQQIAGRSQALQSRATALDADNRELQTQVAQYQQQVQLLKDQLTAVRQQLRTTNQQLASARTEKQGLERHTKALAASVQRRAGATIRANNSLVDALTVVQIPNVEVRQDGDVIRIELPGDTLFQPGTATLKPGASRMIDGVLADILQHYPNQMLGIEGHTDSVPVRSSHFPSNHHLSTARATSVYEHLMRRHRVPPKQVFVVGHGGNHPVVSNATPAGKSRNRRVEVVVYPERYQQ